MNSEHLCSLLRVSQRNRNRSCCLKLVPRGCGCKISKASSSRQGIKSWFENSYMSSEQYNARQIRSIPCTEHRKDSYTLKFDSEVKKNLWSSGGLCHLNWVYKWRMEASSSCIIVSGHKRLLRGLVNADRMTCACAKRRAWGCEMNQPSLPNTAHRQLMRSPQGWRGLSNRWRAPALNVRRQRGEGRRGQGS